MTPQRSIQSNVLPRPVVVGQEGRLREVDGGGVVDLQKSGQPTAVVVVPVGEDGKLRVYFTHPYSSCEKGTNECHNRMLRRFIPKGKSISDYTAYEICFFADCINGLPRKILDYHTPEELFDRQLDRIYAA